jgi:hypothetical protein
MRGRGLWEGRERSEEDGRKGRIGRTEEEKEEESIV